MDSVALCVLHSAMPRLKKNVSQPCNHPSLSVSAGDSQAVRWLPGPRLVADQQFRIPFDVAIVTDLGHLRALSSQDRPIAGTTVIAGALAGVVTVYVGTLLCGETGGGSDVIGCLTARGRGGVERHLVAVLVVDAFKNVNLA